MPDETDTHPDDDAETCLRAAKECRERANKPYADRAACLDMAHTWELFAKIHGNKARRSR